MKKVISLALAAVMAVWAAAAGAAEECRIGSDAVDPDFKARYEGPAVIVPAGTLIQMKGRSGKHYICRLADDEPAAADEDGTPRTLLSCGNPIVRIFRPREGVRAPTALVGDVMRLPLGHVHIVDGSNAKARLTAEQVKVRFGLGAGIFWHKGLKGTNVYQSQSQSQTAQGGAGGHGGAGGAGGAGGDGGNAYVTLPPDSPSSGGPVNPNNPGGGGGGPANPNNPGGGGAGQNPNNP